MNTILAAVDLGSNSFHLAIARLIHGELQLIDSVHDRVQLAAGLSASRHLDEASQTRGLEALKRFADRLHSPHQVLLRAVGTDTLRVARNAHAFIEKANAILGTPIEVISGEEEARLIYRGVTESLREIEAQRTLVIDIGGGSTELVLGTGTDCEVMRSLHMGCVGFTNEFFADGIITRERFRRAQHAAQLLLERLPEDYFADDWKRCYGSSGTMVTLATLAQKARFSSGALTLEALTKLRDHLISVGHCDRIQLDGLKPQRRPVLAAGLAIARAVFRTLPLRELIPSEAALREGVLFELRSRLFGESDVRESTVAELARRFHVDREHAARVTETAQRLIELSQPFNFIPRERLSAATRALRWAARLHEVGLAINFHSYHKHGAYILSHTTLPGFSQEDTQLLAALVLSHRKKFSKDNFAGLSRPQRELGLKLAVLLRLAVRLNRLRNDAAPISALHIQGHTLELILGPGYLDAHPLTRADLEAEAERLSQAGFTLLIG